VKRSPPATGTFEKFAPRNSRSSPSRVSQTPWGSDGSPPSMPQAMERERSHEYDITVPTASVSSAPFSTPQPPASFQEVATASARERDGWRVPIPSAVLPPEGSVSEEEQARYVGRLRDQPLATFAEPLRLTGAVEGLRRASCAAPRAGSTSTRSSRSPLGLGVKAGHTGSWPRRTTRS
jgi:hypothetical protein